MAEHKEGWGRPAFLPKGHYFRDGISLCGAWRYLGMLEPGHAADGDCRACARVLKRSPGPEVTIAIGTPTAVTVSVLSETRQ